ncbi:hypothetical protein SAMN05421686_103216 [Thalassolituus maritimus]|uniref:Uncharacterized protein n=1 Tax=Thalassolituus maritimus TaxID=484498 RepID=A0A1N7L1K7_9GAMM|nr:hypothetical protein [Thalassolituus maritimus]SIS67520.1 hypothetical protein SAMN05421686_103216 [Thalassolituus maritimus]
MNAAIKSLTPKVLRDFVLTAILSRWEGDRDWGSVDVEIRQFKYLGIGESNEPIEFYCRIYSREWFSWLCGFSIKDVCDVIASYLEDSLDCLNFRCEAVRYEMRKVPGTNEYSIDLEIKIVDSDNYTGNLGW